MNLSLDQVGDVICPMDNSKEEEKTKPSDIYLVGGSVGWDLCNSKTLQ